ncbi:hypothetical protein HHI36_021353 [Cryptolaemus montrouzieri]|uniref:C2H2-type domain-containing protein n=1 Tax=Cryptolaemus montrouzieri TaxID=559131 RepID=A0ABD2MWI7_9CUCU
MAKVTCFVCLNTDDKSNLSKNDSPDINIIEKLQNCVPEIEWKSDCYICPKCSEKIEFIYDFRHFCIKLQDERLVLWKEVKDEKIEEVIPEKPLQINNFTSQHIKSEHKKFKEYNCKYCTKKYTSEIFWKKHEDRCGNEQKIEENSVIYSQKDVKNNNECDLCGTLFNNKYLLKRHKKNVHATEKNYKCDLCPSSFVSPVYLNAHKKYHSGDRKHICLFCGKGYITASDLYHHEKIHANKREYTCSQCSKAFNTSSDLHKHKICVHVDRKLWKYSCNYCERKFPLKINLDAHIKTHTGEKNFSCHFCDKKCISRSALTRHLESHSNVKSFRCTLCSSGYKYQKSLDIHMMKSHGVGDVKIPERIKKYFCHICPKSYYVNSKLEKHLRSHAGDRPFKCPNCEKCFVDKSYIKQHMKVAHNIPDI